MRDTERDAHTCTHTHTQQNTCTHTNTFKPAHTRRAHSLSKSLSLTQKTATNWVTAAAEEEPAAAEDTGKTS